MRFGGSGRRLVQERCEGVPDDLANVLSAYERFAAGDPSPLIEVLDPDIEWRAQGSRPQVGRDNVARRLAGMTGALVQLVGVRRGASVLVLEFTRPWWRARSRRLRYGGPIIRIRGEQAVWIRNGLIARIESRERIQLDGE